MPTMTPDRAQVAKAVALGRIGLGAVFTVMPSVALSAWPGRGSRRMPVARLLARSVGVRDLALGVGTLAAIKHDAPLRGWIEAGVLADAGDALAIVLGFRHLPRRRAALAFLSAAGAAAAGQWLVREMGRPAAEAELAGLESA